jgi:CIC family chloride channel protein
VGIDFICGAGTNSWNCRNSFYACDYRGRRGGSKSTRPIFARATVWRIIIGIIAIAFPQILGIGYGVTDIALAASLSLGLMVAVGITKIIGTAVRIGVIFGGSIFSPALLLGAMVGGGYGLS